MRYRIVASIVLSRAPVILRDPHPFELQYYLYQQKLGQLHSTPFPINFYFKKGSLAEKQWLQRKKNLVDEAVESFDFKNDKNGSQILKSSLFKNYEDVATSSASDDFSTGIQIEEELKIASRITKADMENNVKSLDRALQRTLYLIVKKPRLEDSWQFPQGGLDGSETLLEAATRELKEECGDSMDIWFVGRRPIGYNKYNFKKPLRKDEIEYIGSKAHIFAGQVKVDNKEIIDFAWVTKQELREYVESYYYDAVKDMLSEL
ncbi:5685_t:CDS:2 [Entrophospora sp. SA101]|nr:15237_t:CDS:2 [Entrophospora sp. SA101]CAJ0756602.1 5685_t:CDS:2 [Entrophospora sp. SA101]CAJ0846384.1 8172_t:CDS:2 [Entrophospora sp. SA101]